MQMFRELGESEEREFRQWARDNYRAFEPISGVWHPVVQDECARINRERGANATVEEVLG